MILTLTPTPAIDITYGLDDVRPGSQMRATSVTHEASGKGYNVSVALAQRGIATAALVAHDAGPSGHFWDELAQGATFPVNSVLTSIGVRINTTVMTDQGDTTRFNEPVREFTDQDISAIVAGVEEATATHAPSWIVCSGSLGPSSARALLSGLREAAHLAGARLAVDTSGLALRDAVDLGVDLIKPNEEELATLVSGSLTSLEEFTAATRDLASASGVTILTTLGPAGVVVSNGSSTHHAAAERIAVINTTGAGDATLAGFLARSLTDDDLATQVIEAVRWGAAACMHQGTAGLAEAAFPQSADEVPQGTGGGGASLTTSPGTPVLA